MDYRVTKDDHVLLMFTPRDELTEEQLNRVRRLVEKAYQTEGAVITVDGGSPGIEPAH